MCIPRTFFIREHKILTVTVQILNKTVTETILCFVGVTITVKEQAEKRSLTAHAATIPTLGIQLVGGKGNNPVQARMSPAEGELLSNNWGLYPMLLVRCTQ